MTENDLAAQADRMINAALGDRTPHQVLIETSLAEAANTDGRAAAIAKNRERALKLLAALEQT